MARVHSGSSEIILRIRRVAPGREAFRDGVEGPPTDFGVCGVGPVAWLLLAMGRLADEERDVLLESCMSGDWQQGLRPLG